MIQPKGIYVSTWRGRRLVMVDFTEAVPRLKLPPAHARELAALLLAKAEEIDRIDNPALNVSPTDRAMQHLIVREG